MKVVGGDVTFFHHLTDTTTYATCKLCGMKRKLCESHIVTEYMYRPVYSPKRRMIRLLTPTGRLGGARLQKGLRERLLCSDCEQFLNTNYEQPNHDFWTALVGERPWPRQWIQPVRSESGSKAVRIEGFNYPRFKLLLLSILWRAAVSTRIEYSDVKLGPHEQVIRSMLKNREPGPPSKYPCIVLLLETPSFGLISPPVKMALEGYYAYQFLLTSVLLWFVVSRHAGSEPLTGFAPSVDGSLVAPLVDPTEVPIIRNAAGIVKHLALDRAWVRDT